MMYTYINSNSDYVFFHQLHSTSEKPGNGIHKKQGEVSFSEGKCFLYLFLSSSLLRQYSYLHGCYANLFSVLNSQIGLAKLISFLFLFICNCFMC